LVLQRTSGWVGARREVLGNHFRLPGAGVFDEGNLPALIHFDPSFQTMRNISAWISPYNE
jgi:hypothetical protein